MPRFRRGTCFQWAYPPGSDKLHLCIVLCDPEGYPPDVILVPVNTDKGQLDRTTILQAGDHRFCKHDTVVSYDLTISAYTDDLQEHENDSRRKDRDEKTFKAEHDMSEEVLTRIIQGALDSPLTPKGLVRALERRTKVNDDE